MGQSSSKTYRNPQMQQLKQLYSPTCKLLQLPGQPLCIQYVSPFSDKTNFDSQRQKQSLLEMYSLQLNLSQKQVDEDSKIYDQRKHNLPWIVKVICYDVQKKRCECSTFSQKYTVCTQRVEFRLNSFKIKGKGPTNFNNSHRYLESLSFQQAVYLLINALQGLQILTQQFRVNLPNARSIGITRQGQVKVWINENWAINDQNSIIIPQDEIIQETLRLVAQRTKDNLFKMLGIEHGYPNLTFQQIQAILSHFVIAFNNGKKRLVERLSEASVKILDDTTKLRKYSLKKEKKLKINEGQIFHTPLKTKYQNQNTDRRVSSIDSRNQKSNSRVAPQNYSNREDTTSRYGKFSQPKKQVKFIYTHPQNNPFHGLQREKFALQMNLPQPVYNTRVMIKSEPLIHAYNEMEHKNNSFPYFEKVISRKISENNKTITITTVNSNQQNRRQELAINRKLSLPVNTSFPCNKNILQISKYQISKAAVNEKSTKKEPFSAVDNNKLTQRAKKILKTVRFVSPGSILAQGDILVTQERSEETIPCKIESINSITEQFRQLLQSDKKIQNQYEFQEEAELFEISLLSLQKSEKKLSQVEENTLLYQKSESDVEMMGRPFETKCYSIKEVDEELSYELQSNYNK